MESVINKYQEELNLRNERVENNFMGRNIKIAVNAEIKLLEEFITDLKSVEEKRLESEKAALSQHISQRSELLAFKRFISKTPLAELELYSDEEFTDGYIKANCG